MKIIKAAEKEVIRRTARNWRGTRERPETAGGPGEGTRESPKSLGGRARASRRIPDLRAPATARATRRSGRRQAEADSMPAPRRFPRRASRERNRDRSATSTRGAPLLPACTTTTSLPPPGRGLGRLRATRAEANTVARGSNASR